MTSQLYQACQQAVHVIKYNGRIIKAGRAAMFVLEKIGYPRWLVRPLTWPPLVWFVEFGYWIVARNRTFFAKFFFTNEE